MKDFTLLPISLTVFGFIVADAKVKCPVLSRTNYKEQRPFDYSECPSDGWNKCFQEIRLFEITEDGAYAFLFASGCATPAALTAFNVTEKEFLTRCKRKDAARCVHRYQNETYAGTLCCENTADEVLRSWLWDVFFGGSEEMVYELESTVNFVQTVKKGMHPHDDYLVFPIVFSFFAVLVFTALAFLQYYHINDGIIS